MAEVGPINLSVTSEKPGLKTTEFWLSLAFAAGAAIGGPTVGLGAEGLVASGLIVAAYSAGRAYEKAQRAKAAASAVRASLEK